MVKLKRVMTVEVDRIVLRGRTLVAWCDGCAASTPKVTAEQAAMLIGGQAERLRVLAQQEQVHSTRTPGGSQMICLISLAAVVADSTE